VPFTIASPAIPRAVDTNAPIVMGSICHAILAG
jgi:hypothetical protein